VSKQGATNQMRNRRRKGPTVTTIKRLFAHSGNRCAFPGCPVTLTNDKNIIGRICHIKAESPKGQRFDATISAKERNSFSNLILLCGNHHTVIDSDPIKYTVEYLVEMKACHEAGQPIIAKSEVERLIGPSLTFITNHFHAPVTAGPARAAQLKITIDESGPYHATRSRNLYQIKRTYSVKVENTGASRTAHNCKVHLLSIRPTTDYTGPWLLEEGFSLAAGDHKFVPIVRYGEAFDPKTYDCADSFIEILPASPMQPTLDKVGVHSLTLRVTGVEAAPSDFDCNVWVSEDGRLHVAAVPPPPRLLSLIEAARLAYEQTRGSQLADMAERHDGTPDGILEYYAYQIMERCEILAQRLPSQLMELYPKELWKKMHLCDDLSGIKYHGSSRVTYVHPSVDDNQFSEFMLWAKQLQVNFDAS
jgi:hypothetical protein